tara:strand:+ start:1222 stop:1446 length:225 start_codon:yes stop_codon:yes gene_type:complete
MPATAGPDGRDNMKPLNYSDKDRATMHFVTFSVNKFYLTMGKEDGPLMCAHYDLSVIRECIEQNRILNVTDLSA